MVEGWDNFVAGEVGGISGIAFIGFFFLIGRVVGAVFWELREVLGILLEGCGFFWLVIIRKCYIIGVIGKRFFYFICVRNIWVNILES